MNSFLRILRVEILKLRRTLALVLAGLTPLVVVVLQCFLVLRMKEKSLAPGANPWEAVSTAILFWAVLMLPLFVTLVTSLLGQTEHSGDQWKSLFAQPVRRGGVYAAKILVATGLILVAHLVLACGIILAGAAFHLAFPRTAAGPILWGPVFLTAGKAFLASWFIIAVQAFIGLRWRSFVVASSVGIVATISSVLILNADRWSRFFPWSLPAIASSKAAGTSPGHALVLGIAGGLLAAVLGGRLFVRRDVI